MSDKELLAQIAQVAGAINKHQLQSQGYFTAYNPHPAPMRGGYGGYSGYNGYNMRGRGRGRGAPIPHTATGPFNRSLTLNNKTPTPVSSTINTAPSVSPATPSTATKPVPVPAPVQSMQHRPIMNKPFVPAPAPSRHLTLVNKNTTNNTSTTLGPLPSPASSPPKNSSLVTAPGQQWIQSKGKNMSLMNPTTFRKTMVAKEKSIRTAKEKKLKLMQVRAKRAQDLHRGIVTMGGQEYSRSADGRKLVMRDTTQDNIVINGVEFRMDPRGNKLVRAAAAPTATTTTGKSPSMPTATPKAPPIATPKQFSVGGVVYVRTHSGNLVRATLVKNQLLEKRAAQEALKTKRSRTAPKKARPFCKYYTRFGVCSRNIGCPFIHSRSHLAICKKFLRGVCPNTEATCKLSHTPSPHTAPACVHFQRAACNKDNCVYTHVRTNPQAPICRPFATEGWCEAGSNCKDRHVWICPDFGTDAGCKKKCGLPHVPNGGIWVKKSSDGNDIALGGNDKTWTRPDYQPSSSVASTSRYTDKQDQDAEGTSGGAGSSAAVRNKNRQYDENFIPLDLGDDFEAQQASILDEDEDVVMSDQEMEEDEEEEEDVSSDGMETGGEDDDDEGEGEGEEELGEDLVEDVDDDEEEMNEEDEYNMYQEQRRYEDDDDY
ncbi:hypothetical protein EC957_000219 [Mortierella hygrophila]|uniref:C3H1-type domain-containing protein n=1 Tax=Mortierella hygrophila TaxID=979708 RepID=A0A9P6FGN9_9FUNG|nr:hypothetical protein EC957_000219 [Mortierella hygrophila]